METASIYIHIPFCKHRCAYCDFNTYADIDALIPDYLSSLRKEMEILFNSAPYPLKVHSIYFGGGTPSLLPIEELESLLRVVVKGCRLSEETEITLEANPGTISRAYLLDLKQIGINRLSLGMQSSNQYELEFLERQHTHIDVIEAVIWARQAGIDNINLDLLFAIPYQTLEDWKYNLKNAVALQPEHLSLYSLILEEGTPIKNWVARGLVDRPDPDLDADMYIWAGNYLASQGYLQYEISNWAQEAGVEEVKFCAHNLQYWRNKPYIGFGAGAHGFAGGIRTQNVSSPTSYIKQLIEIHPLENDIKKKFTFPLSPATTFAHTIDIETEMNETMMMGLRLTQEGVSRREFKDRFGLSLDEVFGVKIERLISLGLIELAGGEKSRLRLSTSGRLLGNLVFMEFV